MKFTLPFLNKIEDKKPVTLPKVDNKEVLIKISDLVLSYKNPSAANKNILVIRGASLHLKAGEILAIIGESGSGKSVITSTLYGLAGETADIESGTINVMGTEVQTFSSKQWEKAGIRGVGVSAVFQNPMTTLNPTMMIGKQIMEGMLINKLVKNKEEARQESIKFLTETRITNPEKIMKMYPHELSGGMKQRVVLAAIVSLRPKVLILDEPTTALDPTVQALVLDIVRDLKVKYNISVIFITHDLGVVAAIADRIAIMYAGQIIEEGTRDEIMWNPQHPYTWGLLLSMPDVNSGSELSVIKGSVPASLNNVKGDAFAPRNDYAMGVDFDKEPPMFKVSKTHKAKTWLLSPKAPKYEPPKVIKQRWAKFKKGKK